MPEVVSCPKCQRKSRVPDNLLGKKVKCPGCNEVFTAELGKAPVPPRPQKKADDGDTYEVVDEKKKRRRSDDDDEDDDRVSDRPRPRRGRDDEDDDDDRVTTRRRRFSRDDDEDDDEGPDKAALAADWTRVRLGFSLLLSSVLTLIGGVLVSIVGGCCLGAGLAAQMGKQGPRAQPDLVKMSAGIVVVAVVSLVITLVAKLVMIVGSVMCLSSPRAYGSRMLALVTLLLAGGATALWLMQNVVNVAANGLNGLNGAGNPFGGAAGGPPGGAALAVLMALGLIQSAAGVASFFTFGFYVRSIGLCLRDYSLAGTAKGWLVTLTIAVAVGVLGTVAAFAIVGAALFNLARDGGAGPGAQPGAGPGAGPGAALGGGMVAVAGLGCLVGIMALVLLVWYVILLAQARTAISTRRGRR